MKAMLGDWDYNADSVLSKQVHYELYACVNHVAHEYDLKQALSIAEKALCVIHESGLNINDATKYRMQNIEKHIKTGDYISCLSDHMHAEFCYTRVKALRESAPDIWWRAQGIMAQVDILRAEADVRMGA